MSHNLHAFRDRIRHMAGAVAIAVLLLALPPAAAGFLAAHARTANASPVLGRPAHGDLVARIAAPRVGLRLEVLEGTDAATLAQGAGRVPASALPGEDRGFQHCVIAISEEEDAARIAALRLGDEIEMKTPFGMRHLRVVERRLVSPRDFTIAPSERPRVTLAARAAAEDGIGPSAGRLLVSAE
jgi:LPXTG-site transpeptidase (sortase) family protein